MKTSQCCRAVENRCVFSARLKVVTVVLVTLRHCLAEKLELASFTRWRYVTLRA